MSQLKNTAVTLFFFLFISNSFSLWSDIVYTGALTTTQVVPTANDPPSYSGNSFCIYVQDATSPTLSCKIQHDVPIVREAMIAVAPRNLLGETIYNFTYTPFSYFIEQTFALTNQSGYLVSSQIEDFLNGMWYIQLNSDDFPNGVLRAQLEHVNRAYSLLSVSNTIPRASGSTATGIALADYSFYNPSRLLQVDIVHNINLPTSTQIRLGYPGQVGTLVYDFSDATSPEFDSVTYTLIEGNDFLADTHFLNILSTINPAGEIRGQLTTIDYIDELGFTSRLAGESTNVTNNLGCALIGFDCYTRVIQLLIMHDIPDPTGGFISLNTTNGNATVIPILSFRSYESPIYFSAKLTPQQQYYLFSQELVITITSTYFPRGEISGLISVEYDFYAYLSGSNVVPPITTSSVGCATFTLNSNNELDYSIFHSVSSPTEVNFNYGNEGQNGVVSEVTGGVFSPVRGISKTLDSSELTALIYNQVYITVNSESYPFYGEVRGQIKRVNPCSATEDHVFSVVQSSIGGGNNNIGGGGGASSDSPKLFSLSSFIVLLAFCIFLH